MGGTVPAPDSDTALTWEQAAAMVAGDAEAADARRTAAVDAEADEGYDEFTADEHLIEPVRVVAPSRVVEEPDSDTPLTCACHPGYVWTWEPVAMGSSATMLMAHCDGFYLQRDKGDGHDGGPFQYDTVRQMRREHPAAPPVGLSGSAPEEVVELLAEIILDHGLATGYYDQRDQWVEDDSRRDAARRGADVVWRAARRSSAPTGDDEAPEAVVLAVLKHLAWPDDRKSGSPVEGVHWRMAVGVASVARAPLVAALAAARAEVERLTGDREEIRDAWDVAVRRTRAVADERDAAEGEATRRAGIIARERQACAQHLHDLAEERAESGRRGDLLAEIVADHDEPDNPLVVAARALLGLDVPASGGKDER